MPYSLIDESWLPVRRRSGATERIAPWQETDRYDDDPVVALAREAPGRPTRPLCRPALSIATAAP